MFVYPLERLASMVSQENLEELYGPAARHSEHQEGLVITYRDTQTGETKTGGIIWICAPGRIGDRDIGTTYVVEPPGGGWPDMVFPGDVLTAVDGS